MWIRQCELDAAREEHPPIPSRIASNEEFIPPPQSPQQQEYEARLMALSAETARRRGMDRRSFLRSASGMAAALLALNQVFGDCYQVEAAELVEEAAFTEKWPKDQFIFDVQTHHVDLRRHWYDASADGRFIHRLFQVLAPTRRRQEDLEQWNRIQYVKEVFGDSDTVMAVISGVPTRDWSKNPLPPDLMAATRQYVNDLAGSQRVLSQGLLRPNLGRKELDEMERQAKELKVDAWKCYPGAELDAEAWRLDDEKVAYPFWDKTQKLGITNICVHKGLPLSVLNTKGCRPDDVEKAAKDWPGLNFILYHSAFRGFGAHDRHKGRDAAEPPDRDDPQYIPWVSDVLQMLRQNPTITNVYCELGATFHQTSMFAPVMCMHMLAQMMQVAGADHILWGTDSVWGGGPQSQIVRMRQLRIHDQLIERYAYPQLTDEVKAQIFGLNAAKLFGVDPQAKRREIRADKLTAWREQVGDELAPSNTQFGWVWEGGRRRPTTPVGG